MISCDKILFEFAKGNAVSIWLLLMFLKGLSDISSWTWDNKVVDLLRSMANGIRPMRNGNDINMYGETVTKKDKKEIKKRLDKFIKNDPSPLEAEEYLSPK